MSSAVTPDLLPRCLFGMCNGCCGEVVCRIQRLVGSGSLAVRPECRRYRRMVSLFKSGSRTAVNAWRQLEIGTQMGLLQEGVLATRARRHIWSRVSPGESGHWRDSGDSQFALSSSASAALLLATLVLFGVYPAISLKPLPRLGGRIS